MAETPATFPHGGFDGGPPDGGPPDGPDDVAGPASQLPGPAVGGAKRPRRRGRTRHQQAELWKDKQPVLREQYLRNVREDNGFALASMRARVATWPPAPQRCCEQCRTVLVEVLVIAVAGVATVRMPIQECKR